MFPQNRQFQKKTNTQFEKKGTKNVEKAVNFFKESLKKQGKFLFWARSSLLNAKSNTTGKYFRMKASVRVLENHNKSCWHKSMRKVQAIATMAVRHQILDITRDRIRSKKECGIRATVTKMLARRAWQSLSLSARMMVIESFTTSMETRFLLSILNYKSS